MAAALSVGRRGQGRTAPNPAVGAVLVRDGPEGPVIVGAGWTQDGGRPHAERMAILQAGEAARGATLHVTLEPCSHYGRTPPCADAVIEAGIARAVVATLDPNPVIAGRGVARLEAAGIAVTVGERQAEARRDLAGHIRRMTAHRPHVRLKLALSAEGAIGRRGEGQIAITGPASRTRAHILRAESDAIAVGVGTVLADDPALTCRLPGMAALSPTRVVLDTHARTPLSCRLLADVVTVPVVICVAQEADRARTMALSEAGAQILPVPVGADGRIDLAEALVRLAGRGITTVLVEGGAVLADALVGADLVDEAFLIASPVRLGGDPVLPLAGRGAAALAEGFDVLQVDVLGEDRWTHLWRLSCSQGS
jgi:diaminohydroxyphosphoribosylaminopyrimidine deaminase/5-amino-6-(5-phosphoribosylamino)uracil reductase